MNLKLPLVAAFVAVLSLSACGGGGSGSSSSSSSSSAAADDVAQLSSTDNTVGTGAKAVSGNTVNVTYTLWLYSASASDHKGTQLESGPFTFKLGSGQAISGFDQGVQGMLVGGTRTILVPSSMGYGATGSSDVPPNAGLVFQVTLNSIL